MINLVIRKRKDSMNYYLGKDNNIKLYNCDCNFLLDNLIEKNVNIDLVLKK